MFKTIFRYFDKFEDKVRGKLSHSPILYAFIGGLAIVFFWRGVWATSDIIMSQGGFWGWFFYEPIMLIWSTIILLATGLFFSFFIGDRVILSGVRHEKKIEEKTVEEIEHEESEIKSVLNKLDKMSKDIEKIKNVISSL